MDLFLILELTTANNGKRPNCGNVPWSLCRTDDYHIMTVAASSKIHTHDATRGSLDVVSVYSLHNLVKISFSSIE